MTSGLPLLLAAFAAGLAAAPYFAPHHPPPFVPWLLAGLWWLLRKKPWAIALLLVFLVTLGATLYQLRRTPPAAANHIAAFVSTDPLAVEGTVRSVTLRSWGTSFLDLDAELVAANGIAAPVTGRMRLFIAEGEPSSQAGDRIRFLAKPRQPRPFGTPGEFDYPRHLAARGIFVTANLPRAADLVPLVSPAPTGWRGRLEQKRQETGRRIDQLLPTAAAPMVRALTIGDKAGIPPATRELLAATGVSHLFAISGLHLGLIALLLYSGASLLYRRFEALLLHGPPGRYLPALLLPALALYLFFTGAAIATQRAFLAALCTALLLLFGRGTPPLHLLASVAFFLLLLDPLYLFEPSFQLSFAGVAGILLLLPRLLPKLPTTKIIRWPLAVACTTLAATLATTPVVLLHFHLLAPAGLLANLLAVPVIGFGAVPLGLTGVLLLDIWPAAAESLLWLCAFLLEETLNLLRQMTQWPPLSAHRLYLSPLRLAAIAVFCWGLLLPASATLRHWPRTLVLALAAVALLLPAGAPSGLTVTALSVGQGDSTLVSLDGRHYLVDGGGLRSETFDVGERLVAPALAKLDVRTLEAVVLTHDHPDHRAGLLHVLAHFPVRAFWSAVPLSELDPGLQAVLAQRQVPFRLFPSGWTTVVDTPDTSLLAFVPELGTAPNDRSLVFYARRGRQGALLTGDLERIGVGELLRNPPAGPVTLLKLPHHGSRHSDPRPLLEFFAPTATFASSGFGNVHRLPHREAVLAVEERGLRLYRTDLQGTIRFQAQTGQWRAKPLLRGIFN